MKIFKNIFSIQYSNDRRHRVYTILGIKLKRKIKYKFPKIKKCSIDWYSENKLISENHKNLLCNECYFPVTKSCPELHLILLWQNARYKEREILEDISKNLNIIDCYNITWSSDKVAENFTRFYGEKLDNGSFKEKECGTGSFLLITVLDNSPAYEFVETSRGFEYVNINLFSLKTKYREWTNGGHKIHTTNSPQETNHDITLLLGTNYDDYMSEKNKWDGTIKNIHRDLTGSNGWKNLKELFYTLNATVNYCVLRNYEILPEEFNSDLHGDIDILTDNRSNIVYISNAKPVFEEEYRVHYKVKISEQDVLFDFRYLGDDYYCYAFENNILKTREYNNKGIFVPNSENSLYSLIYHCLIHKYIIASDYYSKVKELFYKNDLQTSYEISKYIHPFDLYYELLLNFMNKNSYSFTQPIDKSVFYNTKVLNLKNNIDYLQNKFYLNDVQPYMVNQYNGGGSGYCYYTGFLRNGKKVFIKYGGIAHSAKHEFKTLQKLFVNNSTNFLKPYYYECDKDKKCIITEFVEGCNLNDYLASNDISTEKRDSFLSQIENIAKTLIETNIMHRDIRPGNIIVTKDLRLVLIDTQFAINLETYRELNYVLENFTKFSTLGEDYAAGKYMWDDMYSLDKICKDINRESNFIKNKIGKYKLDYNILK